MDALLPESHVSPNSKIDLLLVDDREENLIALEAVLNSPNYTLIKTRSGNEALRYLLSHEPAVILLDVQMPEMDGFETARLIKRSERTREIPIIFITAINKEERFVSQGYAHGAVDYIQKPFDAQILKSKVSVFAELARKTTRLISAEKALQAIERQEREQELLALELRSVRREQAEQKKYLDLVDGINHGIVWSANADSLAVSFVSRSAERILGYPLSQWTSEKNFLSDRVHPDDRAALLKAIREAKPGNPHSEIEHRLITAENREVWLHTGLRVTQAQNGAGTEVRGLSVDITRLKEAEEMLRKNKARSDFMAQASLILAESLDYTSAFARLGTLATGELCDLLAIDVQDQTCAAKCLTVAHANPKLAERARELGTVFLPNTEAGIGVGAVLRTGKSELHTVVTDQTLELGVKSVDQRRTLSELGVRSAMVVPLVARGMTFGALTLLSTRPGREYGEHDLSVAEDLARRVASAVDNAGLYQHAQKAIRTRDEFLSIASHELKTPLTPLKIQTQALMRLLKAGSLSKLNPEMALKMIETSERQLVRLSRLIDDLLDISRISMGKLELQIETVDVAELIHDVVERFSGQISVADCKVILSLPEGVKVEWDRFRIEQVVINLLTNAMKYGAGKPIEITLDQQDDRVRLTFKDQGIGIAQQDHHRIFERFERAVSESNFGGLGLGLYIVSQIIEAHCGKIEVQSAVGSGSTFIVEIPASVPRAAGLRTSADARGGIDVAL